MTMATVSVGLGDSGPNPAVLVNVDRNVGRTFGTNFSALYNLANFGQHMEMISSRSKSYIFNLFTIVCKL